MSQNRQFKIIITKILPKMKLCDALSFYDVLKIIQTSPY